ncbi:MAG: S46 family peptidase [Planctomycetes bacterium]|nr:S46 family peptidase [Planctomycetota bacterium]
MAQRRLRASRPTLTPALWLTALLAAPAAAQGPDHLALGKMWTFENPPLGYLEKEYGFKPDQKWLDSLRLAALRLGERGNPWCSASFVSPQGLIMTNHHCVREQVAEVQGGADWVHDGFAATALEDEVPIPGLTVQQLIAQEDVTARVDAGIAADDDAVTIAKKRADNTKAILAAADAAHPGHLHQVVALYQGAVQQLYRYRVYDDLRLVVAPHLQTAHFGGDPDNFTFPRWSIDFSFVRAYEDGEPADTTAHYFRWRAEGALDGDLVFVPGNPGNTNRQLTVSQLEVQRDLEYPLILGQLERGIAILAPFTKMSPGILTTQLSWQNSYKAIGGMLGGLRDEALMQKKLQHEQHLRGAVSENPELAKKYGDLWREIDRLCVQRREVLAKSSFYGPSYSAVLERGVAIAKALDETVSEEERAQAREQAAQEVFEGNVLTRALLLDHFERAVNWLGADDPFLMAVGRDYRAAAGFDWPKAIGALRRSELGDDAFVAQLLAAGDAAERWAQSEDHAIAVARVLWPLMRDAQQTQEHVEKELETQGIRLGHALHDVYGSHISPDATMTLRFSDGRVSGYPYNGTLAPWATSFYGLFGRGVEFGGKYPFDIPRQWLDAEQAIDLSKRVCFASTNDIVGGNSGSCVVDQELRVVGLIFDGNIESLPNDFYYTQDKARAVSVHTDAIVTALQHVYGMQRIVDELRAGAANDR